MRGVVQARRGRSSGSGEDPLQALRAAGSIDDLDLHFARLLGRLASKPSSALLLAAAAVSRATGEGHVCTDLSLIAGGLRGGGVADTDGQARVDDLRAALESSGVVCAPGGSAPLVLDDAGRLYLWRYHDYQRRVAAALAARARAEVGIDTALLAAGLRRLFEHPPPDGPDRQCLAAAVAVLKPLAVISGGPGTGKTTTVTRILALLVEQALASPSGQPPRIALAAPTGKAAARLQEAIRGARAGLAVSDAVRAAIPEQAATLHRLLGVVPGSSHFRHHAGNPLPVDALVVDEASMVDLALMARLLDALPPSARLVLLGDRDQLASVEAGAVLGEICVGAGTGSRAFGKRLRAIGVEPPPAGRGASALGDCVVLLEHSYRFGAGSGIGRLARRVRAGDAEDALALLREPAVAGDATGAAGRSDLLFQPLAPGDAATAMVQRGAIAGMRPWLSAVAAQAREACAPGAVLDAFARYRVLCAHRAGRSGVEGLNGVLSAALLADGRLLPRGNWYAGRPVMVTRNDYGLRLFNGDTGIALPGEGGELRVWFESADGGPPRALSPGRVPEHQTLFAMTVHKSQGSEFAEVMLVLPEAGSAVLTRELLYTAITRARECVHIIGSESALAAAIARPVERRSGLAELLAGG